MVEELTPSAEAHTGMANATKDKILILAPRANAKDSIGLIDKRLFTGANKLHAVLESNGLWSFHYDFGIMNEPLKQKFTSFSIALKTAKLYFDKRNIDVKEVID